MPIYAYRCTACGHQHDALQKLSEAALVDCPACHAPALTKLLTAPGFQLKGSGWYATDFKSGQKPPAGGEAKPDAKTESGGASESKSESGSTTKGDSKSEAPAASTSGGCGSGCSCH
ncbi:MAG: zinc ribbon domain-containing protein [Burkholderiales bacterium]|jgi:putative FmdB family regulatory protein|nr:zinc ribbon domain-containing protein [Burkholderiales bacterium]